MDTFRSAPFPSSRSDAPKPPSSLGLWPQGSCVSESRDGRSGRRGGQGEEVPGARGGARGQAVTSLVHRVPRYHRQLSEEIPHRNRVE